MAANDLEEEWRGVPNYEDIYQVSNMGRVRRIKVTWNGAKVRVLAGSRNTDGYVGIFLYRNGKAKHEYIHRLVLQCFVGKQEGIANHKDGNKSNNRLSNLEYCTYRDNNLHAYRSGLKVGTGRKLNEDMVREIRKLKPQMSYKKLAEKYGVHMSTVVQAVHSVTWKHVA